jgi:hypothetical protein
VYILGNERRCVDLEEDDMKWANRNMMILGWMLVCAISGKAMPACVLVQGDAASEVEKATIQDLQEDLQKVTGGEVMLWAASAALPDKGTIFLLGTPESNAKIPEAGTLPGSRGGIWDKVTAADGRRMIMLAGSDVQGFQYAVYDYAKDVLGVDPFAYWTGKEPVKNPALDLFAFEPRSIAPPEIPILCYFENDVDELASYRGKLLEYDWESYTEMIDSLVRCRYNAIQLFDMLGRKEFFRREEYLKLCPDYDVDLKFVEKMIDYAHLKGMQVQIDMSLGYKFFQLKDEESTCWKHNKDKWIDAWRYYFEETPIGRCDIFSLRPRNQVWDWEFKSSCGEDKTEVFNEVYAVFGALVDEYAPGATKVAICYHDGMEIFNEDFNPPKDFIVAWCDDGWVGFDYLPKSTKGYDFGTYMHAGFWRNHTVPDPCPELIDQVMSDFISKYDANKYMQVNGQTFRLFTLNLEAFSKVAQSPAACDGEAFYQEWATRYFGAAAAGHVVSAFKKLHEVQLGEDGYVEVLHNVKVLQNHLKELPPLLSSKKYPDGYRSDLDQRIAILDAAWSEVEKGRSLAVQADVYHDQVELPVKLLRQLLKYQKQLQETARLAELYRTGGTPVQKAAVLKAFEQTHRLLDEHIATRRAGDQNPRWKRWYDPAIRRPNNGFPTMTDLKEIKVKIDSL